jgi:hypothetical protein
MNRCYTHRETSVNDTSNAIDSWTEEFSESDATLKSYKKKVYRVSADSSRDSRQL